MGKYMKKAKITGDVAVMEIPQSTSSTTTTSSLGVRTRARTLALQPNPELSYLQLRSRRLEKTPFHPPPSNPKQLQPQQQQQQQQHQQQERDNTTNNNKNPNSQNQKTTISKLHSASTASLSKKQLQGCFGHFSDSDAHEPSFGENNFDFDARERSTRESTPCSLIRDAETIGTPGSATRPTCSTAANRRAQSTHRAIPTNPEMEEFFADFEHHQQKLFIEKYNYDVTNDMPLPGRYEWVRVDK